MSVGMLLAVCLAQRDTLPPAEPHDTAPPSTDLPLTSPAPSSPSPPLSGDEDDENRTSQFSSDELGEYAHSGKVSLLFGMRTQHKCVMV